MNNLNSRNRMNLFSGVSFAVRPATLSALLRKDVKDALRNRQMALVGLMPLLIAAIYKYMDFGGETMPGSFIASFGSLMNVSLCAISLTAVLIAEEKEKNTLRTLMLNNVGPFEFLLSKMIVVMAVGMLVNALVFWMAGDETVIAGNYFGGTLLCMAALTMLGALTGMVCKNQMSTGVVAAPLALLLMFPAIFGMMNDSIDRYAKYLPTSAMIRLVSDYDTAMAWWVLAAWIVLCAAAFLVVYQMKRLDE